MYVFEDNTAVITMTIKGRSPALRHVARTHRVNLDWLFERIKQDMGVHIKYVGTKEQIADMFTKGNFTADAWRKLCRLSQIGDLSEITTSEISITPDAEPTTILEWANTKSNPDEWIFVD